VNDDRDRADLVAAMRAFVTAGDVLAQIRAGYKVLEFVAPLCREIERLRPFEAKLAEEAKYASRMAYERNSWEARYRELAQEVLKLIPADGPGRRSAVEVVRQLNEANARAWHRSPWNTGENE